MKTYKFFPVFILLIFIFFSKCDTTEPPPPPPPEQPKVIFLKLIDVSCTEAFITITANDTVLPINITLNKDDAALYNFTLAATDTIVIDTTLAPNKTYVYQATAVINGETKKSDTLQVRTLDTTSHNFSWQTFTFGNPEIGSSILYDVAIINENNIYAVGEIYLNDSLGNPDPIRYNLAIWNGANWKLRKLTYQGFPPVIHSVLAINEHNVWLDPWFHWNGESFLEIPIDPILTGVGVNKMWGNEDGIYVVGDDGFIAYRNAIGNWQKIESGTELTIHDIWGINNNGDNKILAVAAEIFEVNDEKILSINSAGVTELPTNGLSWSLVSVWFCNKYKEYAGGGGLFTKYYNENTWKEIPTDYYTYAIRGNGSNDIIICGGYGYVAHFNGSTWKNYLGNGLDVIGGNYYSLSIKGNKAAVVGTADGKAVILIGHRS